MMIYKGPSEIEIMLLGITDEIHVESTKIIILNCLKKLQLSEFRLQA